MKLLCFAIFAVLSASSQTTTANTSSSKNIVQLAQSVPDLSTLVTALVAGKLTDALSGAGPFTRLVGSTAINVEGVRHACVRLLRFMLG
jgi:hypothetical protein